MGGSVRGTVYVMPYPSSRDPEPCRAWVLVWGKGQRRDVPDAVIVSVCMYVHIPTHTKIFDVYTRVYTYK